MTQRRGSALLAVALVAAGLVACSDPGGSMTDDGWDGATALTDTEDHAAGVATDGTVAVFSTGGSQVGENAVRLVPLDGSAPSRVLVTEPLGGIPSRELAIAGDTVYVAVGRSIAAVPLAGGEATAVVTDRPGAVTSIAVEGDHLFWTTGQLNVPEAAEVGMVTLPAGAVDVLADHVVGRGSYTSVVPDGLGGAYAASPAGIVHVAPASQPEVVVSDEAASGAVTRIATDGTHLFGVVAGGRNDLFSVPLDGGTVTQLAPKADSTGAIVTVGGGVAFFVGDDLRWVAAGGGDPQNLAHGKYADGTLAVAGDRLVFPADWQLWTVPLTR
jgi:hypothetical protein